MRWACTPDEVLAKLNSRQITEMMAFDRLEALGDYRTLYQIAVVCCVVANANRGKNSKPFTPEDFLVVEADKPEPTSDQLLAKMQAMMRMMPNG